MWFQSWGRVLEVVIAGVVAYAAVVVMLRLSGKRTLAKLNAFDFVVTIALGSLLASVVVSRSVPLVEGVVALATLIALQVVVALSSRRWPHVRGVVTSRPTALAEHGAIVEGALVSTRITAQEVSAAVRKEGFGSLGDVAFVVLETDGSISVIGDAGDGSAMEDVERAPDRHG